MGAQVPSGHRSALTEPAGETVARRSRVGRGYFSGGSHPLTPSHAQTLCEEGAALAREGKNNSIHLISKGELALPLWNPFAVSQG